MSDFSNFIRSKLHPGACPGHGARGELSVLEWSPANPDGSQQGYARLYVWDDKATGREVAGWFSEAGFTHVFINEQVHDESNDIFDGRCEDGVRSWDIGFIAPPTKLTPLPPTICVAEYQWRGQTRRLPAQDLLAALALERPAAPMTLTVTLSNVPNPAA